MNNWRKWLRIAISDPTSPVEFRGSLGMLTGTDARALEAIAACWEAYAIVQGSAESERSVLRAVSSLLEVMQPKCRPFARELIARSFDWDQRARLWPLVTP